MKFSTIQALVVLIAAGSAQIASAASCAFVSQPLSAPAVAAQLAPIAGVYEFMGAQEIEVEGKKVFGKMAVLISPHGVQIGYTVYPSLFAPYSGFQVEREVTASSGRISAPVAALDGSIILETEKDGMCNAVAIRVRGDNLCRSAFVSRNYVSPDLSGLKGCAQLKKLK